MDLKIDSDFIRAERQKRGWSQEHLAAAAGLGIRTIQRMESGSAASSESARCLAAVFEVPFSRLLIENRRHSRCGGGSGLPPGPSLRPLVLRSF